MVDAYHLFMLYKLIEKQYHHHSIVFFTKARVYYNQFINKLKSRKNNDKFNIISKNCDNLR